jgi:hypothetical protein
LYVVGTDVLTRDIWRTVCRAALASVETFGGQADIIQVLGKNLVRRIQPTTLATTRNR